MSLENPEKQLTPDEEKIAQMEEEIRILREENKELKEMATKDPLTGIFNRRGLKEAAALAFAQRREDNRGKREEVKPIAVLEVDIDNFKIINDAFKEGHSGGDRILKAAAAFLTNSIRTSDIVARTGGEEFVIVFNNASSHDIYNKFFDKTKGRARLSFMTELDGENIPINFSGGISMLRSEETINDLDAVIKRADQALYKAKEDEETEDGIVPGRDRLLVEKP